MQFASSDRGEIWTKCHVRLRHSPRKTDGEARGCGTTDLPNHTALKILLSMDAAQIIEQINRLPEEERGKVVEFIRHQPNAETLEAINEPTEGLPRFSSVEELFVELES